MSKLEKLIQQYCPDGVEYVRLDKVANVCRGTRVVKSQLSDTGYPVYQNCLTPMGYFERSNCNAGTTFVICGGAAGNVGYTDVDCWAADDCEFIIGGHQVINRYIYYYLMTKQNYLLSKVRKASIPRLSPNIIKELEIPVPPLPVQEEIVRVLDTFTELQAELQAELQKRQQQYNFYRDILLSNMGNNAEYLAISEFAELKAGKAIKATELSSIMDDNHSHPCFGGNGIRGFIGKVSHIGDYAIIGRQGALCGCVNWASGKFYATEHAVVCTPRPNVSSRYLYHLFTVADLNQYKSQGAQPGLSVQRLNELVFPIPPLEEQNRIVSILDQFDTLTNDLTSGLPAEMEKRRQQYEFYRDKLLTFKRKEA